MSEMWNNVTIYGPPSEVDLFKRQCMAPSLDAYTAHQSGWDGCECVISVPAPGPRDAGRGAGGRRFESVWNFQQFFAESEREYSFSFDTDDRFPEELFEMLAERFPELAFDCECIHSMDEAMGYGWFNAPPGGEEFSQDHDVPRNYWTTGDGHKREPAAQEAHMARISTLRNAAPAGGGA